MDELVCIEMMELVSVDVAVVAAVKVEAVVMYLAKVIASRTGEPKQTGNKNPKRKIAQSKTNEANFTKMHA